jgi:hypothetical protein
MIIRRMLQKILLSFILLFAVSATPLLGQTPSTKKTSAKKEEVKGIHYTVRTTATIKEAEELLKYMEAAYSAYTVLIPVKNNSLRSTIILYKDKEDFMEPGFPPEAECCYKPYKNGRGELVGIVGSNKQLIFGRFVHEGTHQFHHMYFGKAYFDGQLPLWFDEGIADCFGNSELRKDKLFCCLKNGIMTQERLPSIKNAIKNNKLYPLKDFIKLDKDTFMKDGSKICYPQAWSFVHFLLAYPLKEDKKQIVPKGDYAHIIPRLYEAFKEYYTSNDKKSRFKSYEDVYNYAFQTKDKKPIDWDELEKQWKDYVLNLDESDKDEGKEKSSSNESKGK